MDPTSDQDLDKIFHGSIEATGMEVAGTNKENRGLDMERKKCLNRV